MSLTVTEKGYCHDPATGQINWRHPDIAHDVANTGVAGEHDRRARRRARRRGARPVRGPITVVCCDNLPHNGRTVEGIVRAFAQAVDPSLAQWIAAHVTFPCTMVDRIVPATTDDDIAEVARLLGVADAAPVVAEPYLSWVIEDRFAGTRPRWEDAGAQIVADVAPFETMKLRLLNGSHSTLAYLGFLAGHDFIWQASSDPQLATLIERLMTDEVMPTLCRAARRRSRRVCRADPRALPATPRCRTALARLRWMDRRSSRSGCSPRCASGFKRGGSIDHLALAIAGWIRYASGTDEAGRPIVVADPMAAKFAAIAEAARGNAAQIADGLSRSRRGVRRRSSGAIPRFGVP